MKNIGLIQVMLSALLLSGCGGGTSSPSKTADIVIDNVSTRDVGKVFVKKSSDKNYGENISEQPIKASTEVALSTEICDTKVDVQMIATDEESVVDFNNNNLPCGATLQLQVK